MRIFVAICAAAIGCGLVFVGMRDARETPNHDVEQAASQFLDAFLARDRAAMASLLDANAHADLDTLELDPLTGVSYRIKDVRLDLPRAVVEISLISPGDFVRGDVHCVLRGQTWRILGMRFEPRVDVEEQANRLESLSELPGVTVQPLPATR